MRARRTLAAVATVVITVGLTFALSSPGASATGYDKRRPLGHFKHLVVIYEENHSFDNLYGLWGWVGGKRVDGLATAPLTRTRQIRQDGRPYRCLLQNDVNLTSPPLSVRCRGQVGATPIETHFRNRPFLIDNYIKPTDKTCPEPGDFSHSNGIPKGEGLPGGCTRDLVHRFYQEQYQLNHGKQNRYVTGSDAVGLAMGVYDTRQLPIYEYLHSYGAPKYVVADRFFQGAFGGSYLNHQWFISSRAPVWKGAPEEEHAVLDTNGFPKAYPLYTPTIPEAHDGTVAQRCGRPTTRPWLLCGNYTINTLLPPWEPTGTFAPQLPPINNTNRQLTIGDQLSAAGVSWAWFAGGWDNAAGNVGGRGWTNGTTPGTCTDPNAVQNYPYCADKSFQPQHQPFNYYTRYAPGTRARAVHLKDEQDFLARVRNGHLPAVSFVKPLGTENEHPGYASEPHGSSHLVNLLKAIMRGPQARDTLVVVTYDEFGGQWDHVPPPGQGNNRGPHDRFGPGTRIPALVIAKSLGHSTVDHTSYDSTSIIATIERQFRLPALTGRAAAVNDLGAALDAAGGRR